MESDKYIAVKDQDDKGSPQVVVIDMHNGNAVNKKPMKAEASLMNPVDNIIALKGKNEGGVGHFIQVFNLDSKAKLGMHQFTENVVFWRWTGNRNLALVTDRYVYHWDLSQTAPEKIFDRAGKLAEAGIQIINYAVSSDNNWCLLTAVSTNDGGKTIDGNMQLWCVDKKQQKFLEGHAGTFGDLYLKDDGSKSILLVFSERKSGTQQTRLHIMDVAKNMNGQPPLKVGVDVQMPPEAPSDFAVSINVSQKFGVAYMTTKAGFMLLFDCATGTMLARQRVSSDTVFIAAPHRDGGVLLVNRKGQVLNVSVDSTILISYVMNQLLSVPNRQEIAFNLAQKFELSGADELFQQQFNRAFASGDYKTAAKVAAQCKSGALRTPQVIQQFKSAPSQPGQTSPLLQYFSTLLEFGKLNQLESMEIVKPVVAQGRREFIEKWLKENKLECTSELGDIVKPLDGKLALSIYLRANASQKVIVCFMEQGQFDQIVAYAKKTGFQADYSFLLRNMVTVNPEGAATFAKSLLENDGGQNPLIDLNMVVEVFMQQNRLQETTSILLDALKSNSPSQAALQTKLFEMNLLHAPSVAEAIFQMDMFTHYDRHYIAQLAEKAGLTQRAMEHYTDVTDIKRCMSHAQNMSPEFLIKYFGNLPPEACLECLHDLLKSNRQNLQPVVKAAISYHEQIGPMRLVDMFKSFSSFEGVFYFLGAILVGSADPQVHFEYIQAAARLGNMQEVERVCRESTVYEPEKVKEFLKEIKLSDPRPLIYVCDLHNFVPELAEYLYKNNLMKYIEIYVSKVNPLNCPLVVGTLIDLDCTEDFIKNLLQSVRSSCPVEPLVEEVEKRNRLRLLLPWLEARVAEGNQESQLHNALAKIYIDSNRDPENFLKTNAFYDSAIVGKYCEERDPHLAYEAYKRAWGTCDQELVNVTSKNGLFRLQARYLVERQSEELWESVLNEKNEFRRNVIDQVVSTALPESTNPDEVSFTVKAFITADLPHELIELLEKIVLHNSDFSGNRFLQNLLFLTAIKADKSRVMDYINRLDNFDGPQVASIAIGDPYNLYEEAFVIYKKCGMNAEAMDTLLTNIDSLERASEFAARIGDSVVWYKLGHAQLEATLIPEAIESYLKAEDAKDYMDVIQAAKTYENFEDLVRFLRMARTKVKDQIIDSELVYAYAKVDQLGDMEEFISVTNTANIEAVGDRLFEERHFKAAKMLYQSIPHNSKLASTYVQLGEYQQAVDAAKQANNPKTWKEVNIACVKAGEFRCAQTAGMHIIIHPDHLEELIVTYERGGFYEELIQLLDLGIGNERSHIGMYTELGILYAKYKKEKLMDFIMLNQKKFNIPKLIRACERHYLWKEAVFLYTHYDEWDSAANTMIMHSPIAWTHEEFTSIMQKVSNMEIYYRAITFYLEEQPMLLNSLLNAIAGKVDHARVVQQVKKAAQIALILPYLKQVQVHNIPNVNEAINEIYVEAEDIENLRASIEDFDNFDQVSLAQKLEKHELLEMRRAAALLYKKNKRFKQSIELSKSDKIYKDAMETTRESGSQELAESLMRFFVEVDDKECFAAVLYSCYDLIKPDIALELAWRHRMMDFVMPYLIQVLREHTSRLDALDKKTLQKEEEEAKEKSAPNDYVPDYVPGMGPMMPGLGNLALMPPMPMTGMGMNNMGGMNNNMLGMQPSPHMQNMGMM